MWQKGEEEKGEDVKETERLCVRVVGRFVTGALAGEWSD